MSKTVFWVLFVIAWCAGTSLGISLGLLHGLGAFP